MVARKKILSIFFRGVLAALVVVLGCGAAGAQSVIQEKGITVKVLVVKAFNESNPVSLNFSKRLDHRLSGIEKELTALPYSAFQVVHTDQRIVPPKKKEIFQLGGGQNLFVRPLYSGEEKSGLWLRWQEPDGSEILDTRMHIEKGQSMIAGTETGPTGGMVLVVQVE